MKCIKKTIALLLTAVMCLGMVSIPAMAEGTPLEPNTKWYVDWTKPEPAVTVTGTLRTQSSRHGYLFFEAGETDAEYLKNAPVVKLNIKQSKFTGEFELKILGVSSEADMTKDAYLPEAVDPEAETKTYKPYDTAWREKGEVLGTVSGTGVSTVSVDVSKYVQAQTDGKYLFTIVGTGSSDVRCNAFSLEADYSDAAKAKAAIDAIEPLNSIAMENFTLPVSGKYDTSIVWTSSDTTAIAVDGANASVTRPSEAEGDKQVTLTASITVGEATETREFSVTVPAVITSDVVKAVPNADSYAQKGNPDNNFNDSKNFYINGSGRQNFVRFNVADIDADDIGEAVLVLHLRELNKPAEGKDSFGITFYGLSGQDKTSWQEDTLTYNVGAELGLLDSSLESYGSGERITDKTIKYDEVGAMISVDITDYVKSQNDGVYALRFYGDAVTAYFDTRECETEEHRPYLEISRGDAGAVIKDTKALTIDGNVSDNFTLPIEGENGSQITWTSNNPALTIDGANADVSAIEEETTVTLTAVITKGEYERTKEFEVTIVPINAEADVEADLNALFVPSAVQESFELAVEGTHGSSISWASSNTDVIAVQDNQAVVSEVAEETTVTLTATVSKKNKTAEKSFDVKVLPIGGDTSEADAAADNAAISLPETVSNDFTLPIKGAKGSDISWQSDSALITIDGETAHVTVTSSKKTVTLTATVKNGNYTKTRDFTITIVTDGSEGAIADFTALTIPACIYEGLVLPVSGENGSEIVWSADSALITIDGANLTAQKVTEKTEAVITAVVTNGNFKESKEFAVTILPTMITVTSEGKAVSGFKEGQSIRVGIADGVQFNNGEQMHVATYGASGELLHIWWGLGSDAKIDINADSALGSIGVFVWKNGMEPEVCGHIQKISE